MGTTVAMKLLIAMNDTEMNVKSVFALLSPKVTKAEVSFLKITLAYNIPDVTTVPQAPNVPCVSSGTFVTWYADYYIKKVTRVTQVTDNAVMRITLPEMFPDVTFSVSRRGV